MGIGMEEPVYKDLLQYRLGSPLGQLRPVNVCLIELVHPDAIDPLHGQNRWGRVPLIGSRSVDVAVMGKIGFKNPNIPTLPRKIQLLHKAISQLFYEAREVIGPVGLHPFVNLLGDKCQQIHIRQDYSPDVGSLNLHHDWKAFLLKNGPMSLCQRGRGNGGRFEVRKNLIHAPSETPFDHPFDFREIDWRYIILEPSQFDGQGFGDEIGPHAGDLAEFDKSRTQFLQNPADPFRSGQMCLSPSETLEDEPSPEMEAVDHLIKTVSHENGRNVPESLEITD